MQKRGVSAVVATVLIVMITVVAIALIWAAVIPMVREGVGRQNENAEISLVSSKGFLGYDLISKQAMVQIKRGTDGVNLTKIRVSFLIDGQSESVLVDPLAENSEKVYTFNLAYLGVPESVSIYPVYPSGKEGGASSTERLVAGNAPIYPLDLSGVKSDYIISGNLLLNGDAESGDSRGWTNPITMSVVSSIKKSGQYSFNLTGDSHFGNGSNVYIEINPLLNYTLSAEMYRAVGNATIRLGFVLYDKNKILVDSYSVSSVNDTYRSLINATNIGDWYVNVSGNCNGFKNSTDYFYLVYNASEDYSDLPNRNKLAVQGVKNMTNITGGSNCMLGMYSNVTVNLPKDTKIRQHKAGSSYMYTVLSSQVNQDPRWIKYSGSASGILSNMPAPDPPSTSIFWPGTKYAQIYLSSSGNITYVDEISLTVR